MDAQPFQKGGGSTEPAGDLVRQHLPLARTIAASLFARRAVNTVEFGDYLQLAYLGLIEAAQRYRADSGAQFSTYATYRIRGSVLNGVAKMTETGERISYLRRARRDRADSILESEKPLGEDLASVLDVVVAVALTLQLEDIAQSEAAEPTAESDPYASRQFEDAQRRLRQAVRALPEREQLVIDLHYFKQMGFEEIAATLQVTKGRVSQLHRRALEQVREALGRLRLAEFY